MIVRSRVLSATIYSMVFATGAAGLVYQVAWQRYLCRLLGSDTLATAIILAAFLGGLSAGYFLCGTFTTRVAQHLKVYAVLEGIIGLWCLCFPVLFGVVDAITSQWSFAPPFYIVVQGLVCSAFLMAVPTICMGGTIPFLTRAISRTIFDATGVHARVYAVNTGGAFLGALVAGFYLVPVFGLPLTVMGTACINMAAFFLFYFLSELRHVRGSARVLSDETQESVLPEKASSRFPSGILYAIAFLSGFYVMTLETVLIRITNLSLGSSSYTFAIIVSVFILAIAVGSFAVGLLGRIPRNLLAGNQLCIAVVLLVLYMSLDTWPYWAHRIRILFPSTMPGFWGYYGCVFIVLCGVLLVPVGCMGATLPIAFHELKRTLATAGSHAGFLFSWNTAGSLAGSLVGGIGLYYVMDCGGVFLTAVLLAFISACCAARYVSGRLFTASLALAVLVLCMLPSAPFYNTRHFSIGSFLLRRALQFSGDGPKQFFAKYTEAVKMLYYTDGPSASIGVFESAQPHPVLHRTARSLMVNAKPDSSTIADMYTLKLAAHIPALLADRRDRIFVIGLGTGMTAGELSLYDDVQRIDVAEISPSVVDALPFFSDDTGAIHEDPRLRIHRGDAFRIMKRSTERWDIIISEPSNPWVTGVDQLFTREFYHLARNHLTDGGILLQWVHLYSSDTAMIGMILNTIGQEFALNRVFSANAGDLVIVASNGALTIEDISRAEAQLKDNSRVRDSLADLGIASLDELLIREVWTPGFMAEAFRGFGVQTQDNPLLHYLAGRLFFLGREVPPGVVYNRAAVRFLDEYLMVLRHPGWKAGAFPAEWYQGLITSLRDRTNGRLLPAARSLQLKAHRADPRSFPLSQHERESLAADHIAVIAGDAEPSMCLPPECPAPGAFRQQAAVLFRHLHASRNWIVPFPLKGIVRLLREGTDRSIDAFERNWCALQLALLFLHEAGDPQAAADVLTQLKRGAGGDVLLLPEDRFLLEAVRAELDRKNAF